jgi:hypothetical protein
MEWPWFRVPLSRSAADLQAILPLIAPVIGVAFANLGEIHQKLPATAPLPVKSCFFRSKSCAKSRNLL